MATTKEQIQSLNIISIINSAGLQLDSANQCLCPFHEDKDTPSFTVYPETSSWSCFGCDVGGDAISFIQKFYNKTFPEALELAGIEPDKTFNQWDESLPLFKNIWNKSKSCLLHPYLKRKKIDFIISKLSDLRENEYKGTNNLVIPIYDIDNNMQGIQLISSVKTAKEKIIQGKYKGYFYKLNEINPALPFYYFEGFADGITAYKALSGQGNFIICFNDGNIKNIVEIFYKLYPDSIHVVCADNDADKPDNPGIMAALKAHDKFKIKIVCPDKYKDLNDLYVNQSIDHVKETILRDMDVEYIEKVRVEAEKFKAEKKQQQAKVKDEILSLPYSEFDKRLFFIKNYGENLKYSTTKKTWYYWDFKKWQIDEMLFHRHLAQQSSIEISNLFKQMADVIEEKKEKKELYKEARSSESKKTVDNILDLSRSEGEIPININLMDKDKFLFNCQNGILDLKKGKLISHDRKYLQSKISPVEFIENAKSELWENFLETILPDKEKREYLQRYLGYCLSGDTSEQKFLIATGHGSNGKSVINQVVSYVIGQYADVADTQSFSEQQVDAIREDLAGLKGARFVATSEPKERMRMDTSVIKKITGDHLIKCRFMRENSFSYEPEFKILFICNIQPEITAQDHGTWRRITVLKFNVIIPDKDQDTELAGKLIKDASAILYWLYEGFKEWQQQGLNPPESVKMATREYRENSDSLADFFNEKCFFDCNIQISTSELYKAYKDYMIETGQNAYGKKKFNSLMRERGFFEKRSNGMKWQGIGLLCSNVPFDSVQKNSGSVHSVQILDGFSHEKKIHNTDNINNTIKNGQNGQNGDDIHPIVNHQNREKEMCKNIYNDNIYKAHTPVDSVHSVQKTTNTSIKPDSYDATNTCQNYPNLGQNGQNGGENGQNQNIQPNCTICDHYVKAYETCLLAKKLNRKIILCAEFKKECQQYI